MKKSRVLAVALSYSRVHSTRVLLPHPPLINLSGRIISGLYLDRFINEFREVIAIRLNSMFTS